MDVVARMHGGGVSARRPAPCATASAVRFWRPIPTCAASSSAAASSRATRASRSARRPASRRPASVRSSQQALDPAPWPAQLFGTDGVRGVAGELLTAELALGARPRRHAAVRRRAPRACSSSATRASPARCSRPRWRPASPRRAATSLLGGVLPTPGAPLLIRRYGFDLAAVISASHNPYRDNGIKFFARRRLQALRRDRGRRSRRAWTEAAAAEHDASAACERLHGTHEDYLRALHERFADLDLTGRRRRCSTAPTARRTASRPRSSAAWARGRPSSTTIPTGATSTRAAGPPTSRRWRRRSWTAGTTSASRFDGDGDRVLAVDRTGTVVDGDELIALAALHLRHAGRLPGDGVAVTVMTNYGFHTAMREAGIEVATTRVGDRYVLEALRERGWALGGEQSGHIIDMDFNATGRRHRRGAADARGARRRRPRRPPRDGEAAPAAGERPRGGPRRRDGRSELARGQSSARRARSRAAAACWCGPAAPSSSFASWSRRRRDDEAVAACDRLVAVVTGAS